MFMLFLLPSLAWAVLPPSAESLRRLKTIAESPAVYEKISVTDKVIGITETKEGYVVTTNRCRLFVSIQETDLKQMEPNLVGPPKLDVVIGDMKCQKGRPARATTQQTNRRR